MSNFINALKTFTNTQVGEKGHAEKAWSFDIDEKNYTILLSTSKM